MSDSDAYTDVVELCALLQCLGFSLKSLDSTDGNMSHDGGLRTVIINCQEFGCNLLGSLPKGHRERLTRDLREMIRCIKQSNESDVVEKLVKEDKSASMTDLKTPEKLLIKVQAETPTRYRSLDTLTANKDFGQMPALVPLQRTRLVSDCDDENEKSKTRMCRRQSTYTISSTPGGLPHRNKTSSPIQAPSQNVVDHLLAAEKAAEDLHNRLAHVVREFMEEGRNDSSISSLALDVSKISMLKAAETTKAQFASSPNLSGISAYEDVTKSRLKRYDSASTSNLALKSAVKEGKIAKLRRISPNIFKKKESPGIKTEKVKSLDSKSKLNCLFKPKIVTPIRVQKSVSTPESSPNLSTSAKKKYSHVKSTIPRPAKKE